MIYFFFVCNTRLQGAAMWPSAINLTFPCVCLLYKIVISVVCGRPQIVISVVCGRPLTLPSRALQAVGSSLKWFTSSSVVASACRVRPLWPSAVNSIFPCVCLLYKIIISVVCGRPLTLLIRTLQVVDLSLTWAP